MAKYKSPNNLWVYIGGVAKCVKAERLGESSLLSNFIIGMTACVIENSRFI